MSASLLGGVVTSAAADAVNTLTFGLGGQVIRYVLGVETAEDIAKDIRAETLAMRDELESFRHEARRGMDAIHAEVSLARADARRAAEHGSALRRGRLEAARLHLTHAVDSSLSPDQRLLSLQDARRAFVEALPLLDDYDDLWSAHRQLGLVWVVLGARQVAISHLANGHAVVTAQLDDLSTRIGAGLVAFLDLPLPTSRDQLRVAVIDELKDRILRSSGQPTDEVRRARHDLDTEVGALVDTLEVRRAVQEHLSGLAAQLDVTLPIGHAMELEAVRRRLAVLADFPGTQLNLALARQVQARMQATRDLLTRLDVDRRPATGIGHAPFSLSPDPYLEPPSPYAPGYGYPPG